MATLDELNAQRDNLIRRLERIDDKMAELEMCNAEYSVYYANLKALYESLDSELLTVECEMHCHGLVTA